MHVKKISTAGSEINDRSGVLVMIHGRGGSAEDIISISTYLEVKDFAILAPESTNNSWYHESFMAPVSKNEPWLSSALDLIKSIVDDIYKKGISSENIYFLGFSQGACLTLEFVTRNAERYGGVVAFTGGLIGDRINNDNYKGDFLRTPIFIGTSDPDPHVPVDRVHETAGILKSMNADVITKIYNGMGHTVSQEELDKANQHVFRKN